MDYNISRGKMVFISHASEDKDRFVRSFAQKCLSNGIDCWYDEWEMKLGDNLLEKISEGLRESAIFVIVLSNFSVNKPWVREELNAALIQKINDKMTIIPIVLGDCEIPILLQPIKHLKITDITQYDDKFKEFRDCIKDISTKPPLVRSTFLSEYSLPQPKLNHIDFYILSTACEIAILTKNTLIQPYDLWPRIDRSIPNEKIEESIEYLNEIQAIEVLPLCGLDRVPFQISDRILHDYLYDYYPDFRSKESEVLNLIIIERENCSSFNLQQRTGLPLLFIEILLRLLINQGAIVTEVGDNGDTYILHVTMSFIRSVELGT